MFVYKIKQVLNKISKTFPDKHLHKYVYIETSLCFCHKYMYLLVFKVPRNFLSDHIRFTTVIFVFMLARDGKLGHACLTYTEAGLSPKEYRKKPVANCSVSTNKKIVTFDSSLIKTIKSF